MQTRYIVLIVHFRSFYHTTLIFVPLKHLLWSIAILQGKVEKWVNNSWALVESSDRLKLTQTDAQVRGVSSIYVSCAGGSGVGGGGDVLYRCSGLQADVCMRAAVNHVAACHVGDWAHACKV